jgi:hypothetical protein
MRLTENGMVVSGLAHHERPERAVSPTATVRQVLAVKSEMESRGKIVRPRVSADFLKLPDHVRARDGDRRLSMVTRQYAATARQAGAGRASLSRS